MLLGALKSYYVGNINRHIANIEIFLRTSVGIGEHSDIQGSIDKELEAIDKYDARLSMLINTLKERLQKKVIKKKKNLSRQERGLGKYDAPLKLQYNQGITGFRFNKKNPFPAKTMQHREWQRGYNFAYFKQVEKNEARKRS